MTEDLRSVTEDMEDSGWLPLPRPDFGSQPLTDRRREAFARALFEGIDVQAAYELAGFKRPRSNAQRMEREPLIQARVNYLRRELDRADLLMRSLRRRQLRQQLMQIATADRLGLFEEVNISKTVGRGRNAYTVTLRRLQMKSLVDLTPEQRALVEGIESDGMRPVLPPKLGALAQLAKLDGLDQPFKFSGDLSVQEKRDATDWSREELLVFLNATSDELGGGDN